MKKITLIVVSIFVAGSLFSFVPNAWGQDEAKSVKQYTVKEIDELRRVCRDRFLFGTSYWNKRGNRISRASREVDGERIVEERVRTYILVGITAKEILAEDKRKHDEHQAWLEKTKNAQGK